MKNTAFPWLATCLLLLVPAVAMQFTTAVRWGPVDFLVMGALVFGMGSLFVLATQRLPRKYWALAGAVLVAVFVYVWAELAVGVFTTIGS